MTNSRSLKLPDQDAGSVREFHLTPRHRALFPAGSADSHSHERHLSWVVPIVRWIGGSANGQGPAIELGSTSSHAPSSSSSISASTDHYGKTPRFSSGANKVRALGMTLSGLGRPPPNRRQVRPVCRFPQGVPSSPDEAKSSMPEPSVRSAPPIRRQR